MKIGFGESEDYAGHSLERELPEQSPVALPLRPLPLANPLSHLLLLLVPVRVAVTDLGSHGHRAKLARFGATVSSTGRPMRFGDDEPIS